MDAKVIGRKIKEARLSKKMTQTEVVGNVITRNMLSQIESGSALPSMKTLAHLCSVLDLPLSGLLSDDAEDSYPLPPEPLALADNSALGQLTSLKALAAEEDYDGLLTLLAGNMPTANDILYDEKVAYLARASYECALRCEAKNDLATAISHAKNAEQYAAEGFYANNTLKADALLLLARLAEQLGKQLIR